MNYHAGWTVEKIDKTDQLFLTLMKLWQNFPHEDLAARFNCSASTISNVVITWLYGLHEIFFQQLMGKIPSRNKNKTCLPVAFASFGNCRIVLDCTEVTTAVPKHMTPQRF